MKSKVTRYIITGVVSLAFDYGTLLFLYRVAGVAIGVATTIGFLIGLTVNFLLNRHWVFDASRRGGLNTVAQGSSYGILVLINLSVTDAVVIYMSHKGVGPEISKLVTTALITIWNFVIYRKVIFR